MDQQADLNQMLENIEAAKQNDLKDMKLRYSVEEEEPEEEPEEKPEPIDIYQKRESSRAQEAKRVRPNGSSAVVNAVVKSVIDGDAPGAGLSAANKKARDDIELLKRKGDITRAEMVRQQYMDEKFIPAIEVVIRYASPDELLNSSEAMKALDDMAISTGSAKGYTASYIKSAYSGLLGQNLNGDYNRSDDAVVDAVRRIKILSEGDEVRSAVGIARQIKDKIDNGENIASEDDYELIGRVASFGD